ncbi:hypothetical protein FQN57_004563 [Myotisia sp. PD_48]|nr:hypothetical protein FQN57_004563 [Myotisia sp. PD_48]
MSQHRMSTGIHWRLLVWLLILSATSASVHDRQHHQHLHRARDSHGHSGNSTASALAAVQRAHAVLASVNQERVQHPNFNIYSQKAASAAADDARAGAGAGAAPPLDYSEEAVQNLSAQKSRRSPTQQGTPAYSIPPELAEAARIVAENTPQIPVGNHSQVASYAREKYSSRGNDTNTPRQVLTRSDGLFDYAPFGGSATVHEPNITNSIKHGKRDFPSEYWMASMAQNGASPFAPQSYKVWRNVRDYGAKGDGVTDDTEAINRAISDGGRCGANCGSSTIYPAVIWFPGGTYLVSTSIIQYYNTQFIGDPLDLPTILAASSFVGLGVITSDVYVSENEQWYINQNNFLRSIKNFIIDIRLTNPYAYVCAIHWQVAQGTSLENIVFYMLFNSDVPHNTQQGIYMENGSGGFLSRLWFIGGNFGAYFGNQQFTTRGMEFIMCKTAVQVHWDWAWTMQGYLIDSCTTGLAITGGAGGPGSTGQGVGSLILVDSEIYNTPNAIVTSLYAENSTSLLVQNVIFTNVQTAIMDIITGDILMAGGDTVSVNSWGFGMISNASGIGSFVNGEDIPMNRSKALLEPWIPSTFFTRDRPRYYELSAGQIINVKMLGALGDGKSDDAPVLNAILALAANISSVVYIPFGIYMIKDTLHIPVGSRIVGQAWSQIMATGPKFADMKKPHVAVQVGQPGDIGIIEIQDMLFTVSGPTAGAILVEWNVHESTQGSVAMWDSHIRVGGAIGSKLQRQQCPKSSGAINPNCIAASLLLHLTPKSTAYLENIWVWVADHDLDVVTQDQIDVYSARGILIESQLAWLYGTTSEHNVLYQYQLSGAKNILMGMIQTESPYFQPVPVAPLPFPTKIFPNDPLFDECEMGSVTCALSWAVRIVDSSSIYILGSGLYSWFSDYSQECLKTENCQQRGFEIEESYDVWIYNLCTKAIVEMVSPFKAVPTYARDNVNGFLSSILAWLGGTETTAGKRDFPGFNLYHPSSLLEVNLPKPCKTALAEMIKCDGYMLMFMESRYYGPLNNDTLTNSVCDSGCGKSLKQWFDSVTQYCNGYNITGAVPAMLGGRLWAAYNETCSKDPVRKEYCNDIIEEFTEVDSTEDMPEEEMCSYCYVERLEMMQRSAFSFYNEYYKSALETVHERCSLTGPTEILPFPITLPKEPEPDCLSDLTYITAAGDTCDSIAMEKSISSAALYMGNQELIYNCSKIEADLTLCLPLSCNTTYSLQPEDSCMSIEDSFSLKNGDVRKYNPWVSHNCKDIQTGSKIYGKTMCLSPQGGKHTALGTGGSTSAPPILNGYVSSIVAPPENAVLAEGTTRNCGKWHEALQDDTCPSICMQTGIASALFLAVNPSLNQGDCTASLQIGLTYCVGPRYTWNEPDEPE